MLVSAFEIFPLSICKEKNAKPKMGSKMRSSLEIEIVRISQVHLRENTDILLALYGTLFRLGPIRHRRLIDVNRSGFLITMIIGL